MSPKGNMPSGSVSCFSLVQEHVGLYLMPYYTSLGRAYDLMIHTKSSYAFKDTIFSLIISVLVLV